MLLPPCSNLDPTLVLASSRIAPCGEITWIITFLLQKNEGKESKHKHRKDKSDRKERHEKERKKEKRKSKTSEKSDNVESPAAELEKQNEPTSLEFMEEKKQVRKEKSPNHPIK